MPDLNDFHAFKSTIGGSGGGGGELGCGVGVIVIIAVIMLIFFIASGASWVAIETLLSLSVIAFLIGKTIF